MSALSEALLSAQKEMPRLTKDSEADTGKFSYRYLSLEGLLREVLPVLNKHGLYLMQEPSLGDMGGPVLVTRIFHFTGDSMTAKTPLALHGEYTAQAQGSAISYARRYALLAMLGLAPDEDDDGAKVSGVVARTPEAPAPAATPEESEDPAKPTQKQHAKLAVNLKWLEEHFAEGAGEGVTWTDAAREFIFNKYGKRSRSQLTRVEMTALVDWSEDRKIEAGVPF